MTGSTVNRRQVFRTWLAWAGASVLARRSARALGFRSGNDRPKVAAIGTGSRWCQKATGINGPHGAAPSFRPFGDYAAVCDADSARLGRAASLVKEWTGHEPLQAADYRKVLDRDDIAIVHISTPDHWHAKIAIEAMLAGKDVYCEKPMTLTIEEGRKMSRVCKDTGRIVQIGTQQRSDREFLTAIALIRDGRIGTLKKAICGIGGATTSPELPIVEPPKELDWNLWQGPVAEAPYRYLAGDNGETQSWSRSHYEFRWWYEYSGGKLTDWGAHHVDIAAWAMDKTETGPTSVNPRFVKHPVPFKDGQPTDTSRYNTATEFQIVATYADGQEIDIRHDAPNGIRFEGTEGWLFVSRGQLSGKAVDEMRTRPLPDGALEKVYKNHPLVNHTRNFFEAVAGKYEPISDVFSHHRALTVCHLAGIAARLGREIRWNPENESIVDDSQAQGMVGREPRKGFEIAQG